MSPVAGHHPAFVRRFPRVSGDEPDLHARPPRAVMFSPRGRGWAHTHKLKKITTFSPRERG